MHHRKKSQSNLLKNQQQMMEVQIIRYRDPKLLLRSQHLGQRFLFKLGISIWIGSSRTHPDLASTSIASSGLNGQSNKRLISVSEVKQHNTEDSMWTVLKGRVYNITPYMKFHPRGVDMLMKAVGKDCTALFNKYHAWVNAEFMLEKCLVGILKDSRQ